ncbi:MAG: polynucleotide adenylyltransferase PcnB [Planctomycetota bacterium]
MTNDESTSAPAHHAPRIIPADSIAPELLDQDALRVISRLERHDFVAYLVGGCVRDLWVGRKPKDFDVATDAHPRQIKRLFRNGRIIGRRFKLMHIYYGSHIVETATFRREPEAREDDESEVEERDLLIVEDNQYGSAEEDARRRDFTVNGLFLDPTRHRIIDYVGGLEDLEAGILRTIGDPSVRIAEDPVRILRAVKFATRLGFRIHEHTWEAMCRGAPLLSRSAPPRVLEEILRLMRSGTSLGALRMLRACGALRIILPDVDRFLDQSDAAPADGRAEHFWRLLEALDADVHTGFVPSTGLCIAVLYLHIVERTAEAGAASSVDFAHVVADHLEPLTTTTRLPRRDVAAARRILVYQRRFTQPTTKRFRPLAFLRSEDFQAALDLFRLRAAARGQGWDIYEGWRVRHDLAMKASSEDLDSERRRTRKRRRRRGGKSASSGESGTASEAPDPLD